MSEPNVNAIPTTRATHHSRTHKLTVTAMLSTVAFLLMFIEFPIPASSPRSSSSISLTFQSFWRRSRSAPSTA